MIPDNATIARFISLHLSQCSKELMAESTWLLRRNGLISSEAVFIDGTKIEANANKYTLLNIKYYLIVVTFRLNMSIFIQKLKCFFAFLIFFSTNSF